MIAELYNKTCTIYTLGTSVNAIGEQQMALTTLASSVPCRINRNSGTKQVQASNLNTRIKVRIYMAPRTDFEEFDTITVDSLNYKVESAYIVSAYSQPHHLEVDCYIELQL